MKYIVNISMAIVLLISMTACKSLPIFDQLVAQPKLEVISFSMNHASLLKQTFSMKIKVKNPNAFSLPVLGLDYGFSIAGVEVAQGTHEKSVTIAAGASDYIDLGFNTNLLKTVPDLKNVIMKGGQVLSYRVTGNLRTKNSLVNTIPFTKTGQFNFAFK